MNNVCLVFVSRVSQYPRHLPKFSSIESYSSCPTSPREGFESFRFRVPGDFSGQ